MKTIKQIGLLAGAVLAAHVASAEDPMYIYTPTANNHANQALSVTNEITPTMTRQQFINDAATGGMKEIVASQLALEKSANADVKKFAGTMIKDHTAANVKLAKIAQEEQLNCPGTNTFATDDPMWNNPLIANPQDIKGAQYLIQTNLPYLADYRAIRQLKTLDGVLFDESYVSCMARDHLAAVNEFEAATQHLADPKLDKFANKTLPTLRRHLKMAQELDTKYNLYGGTNLVVNPTPDNPALITPMTSM